MKKVIDRKLYNTETADKVASWDNGINRTNFGWCYEELYLTKKGAWFIYGEGGPKSKYSISPGNFTSGGSDLIPITNSDALLWLEDHNMIDMIEKYFSDEIEEA